MGLDEAIKEYFAGWNAHDASKIAPLFAEAGTYEDPVSRMAVRSFDLPTVLWSIETVLPDFAFEIASVTAGDKGATVEWVLRGTNSKPLKPGIDATGKVTSLRGVEIFEGVSGFTRVQRYFDQKTLYEQIGMQVIVEPLSQGKAVYGYSKRVASGNPAPPAIVGMTWIRFRDQSELDRIRTHSAKIIQDFLDETGFISIVTGAAGDRAFTVTAWEDEEALHRALNKSHSHAKHDFRTGDISPGVWTSVWKPEHINRIWTRCPACSQPNDVTDNHHECKNCGAALPERPPYW
ncbi:MAG: nuclear transport factor 2 family protein [Terriglobales bacterium]